MRISIAFLLLLTISLSSCKYFGGKRIRGNGVVGTEQRQIGDFSGVEIRGGIDVFVSQGTVPSLRIEGDQNLLKYIEVRREGDLVQVSTRNGYNLKPRAGLKVYASAPTFNKLYVIGSGDIKSQSRITSPTSINAEIRGSGDIQLDVDAPVVTADISGSGDIALNGATRDFKGSIRGSGDIKCFNLQSETSNVDIAGSGDAQVSASKQLIVDIKGAGDVKYKGNPSINQSIKGAGSVTKAG